MRIVDLSHSIHPGMPVFPGDGPPKFSAAFKLEQNGYRGLEITLSNHLGTHLDVPAHIFQNGKTLEQIPAERFFGSACCLDLTSLALPRIDPEDLRPFRDLIRKSEFVLLHTAWSRFWGSDTYFQGHPYLSAKAAFWLAGFSLNGIGIDAASLDSPDDATLAIHHILLERNICLIENLTSLDQLPAEGFMFSCLPMKLTGGDGCPVRAAGIFL